MSAPQDRRTPTPRVGALGTLGEVRLEASRLYRAARKGEVAAADASKLATVLALVARLIEGGELEARLAAVEAKLAEKGTRR